MDQLTTRNADLGDLVALLRSQHARKHDVVVSADMLRSEGGVLVVSNAEPVITDDGVTSVDGRYRPTAIFDEGVSQKLGIPLPYLRRLRVDRPDLYDANVNGWLLGTPSGYDTVRHQPLYFGPYDQRSFLLRTFVGDDGGEGIARALLSNSFKMIDHLDVLFTVLDGIREAGVEANIVGCDLTERKMRVRIAAPQIAALAPELLKDYRTPRFPNEASRQRWVQHSGIEPGDEPVIFAGFELSNSETGGGAVTLTPRLVVLRCLNGLTMTIDALRSVHLGSKLEDGVIRWSDDTNEKQLALVQAQTRDAVKTFLDVEYVRSVIRRLEAKAGKPVSDAAKTIETVCKGLRFSDEQAAGILDHFIQGGQMTAGGVMQAVTSFAQVVEDADEAAGLEAAAVDAMEAAAAL